MRKSLSHLLGGGTERKRQCPLCRGRPVFPPVTWVYLEEAYIGTHSIRSEFTGPNTFGQTHSERGLLVRVLIWSHEGLDLGNLHPVVLFTKVMQCHRRSVLFYTLQSKLSPVG